LRGRRRLLGSKRRIGRCSRGGVFHDLGLDARYGSKECGRLGRSLVRVKPEVTTTLGFVRSKPQTLLTQRRFAKPHDANRKCVGISRVQQDSWITSRRVKRTKTATRLRCAATGARHGVGTGQGTWQIGAHRWLHAGYTRRVPGLPPHLSGRCRPWTPGQKPLSCNRWQTQTIDVVSRVDPSS
jgi:hypothetical protein